MYTNIGKKIKLLAKIEFYILAALAVIAGIILIAAEDALLGLLVIFGGTFISWVSTWLFYGFGEIIDKLCDIEKNTRGDFSASSDSFPPFLQSEKSKAELERIAKIEKLYSKGLITEEEYVRAMSKGEKETAE